MSDAPLNGSVPEGLTQTQYRFYQPHEGDAEQAAFRVINRLIRLHMEAEKPSSERDEAVRHHLERIAAHCWSRGTNGL